MGSEMQVIVAVACVISAGCAIICMLICLWIWRSLHQEIEHGDNSVKDHGERSLLEIRNTVRRIDEVQTRREEQMGELQEAIARVEASSEADDKHVLRPRDLGSIHDKINVVAQEVAGLKGKSDAQYNALREQLSLLQRTLTRGAYNMPPLTRD